MPGDGKADPDGDGEADRDGEAEADLDGEADRDGEADGDGEGDLDGEAEAEGDGEAEGEGDGDGEADRDGEGEGDGDGEAGVGDALGKIVAFADAGATAAGGDALALPMGLVLLIVAAVVAITTPNMHKPVMTPARADPGLGTLTRLTPFRRPPAEDSPVTRYRHMVHYPRLVLAARAGHGVSTSCPGAAMRAGEWGTVPVPRAPAMTHVVPGRAVP